jgi:hypothetical protein
MTPEHQTAGSQACSTAARCPWDWPLPAGQATVLREDGAPRWLAVNAGRVWLTALDQRGQAEDIWLEAGAHHRLPANTAWLLEGWPQASVSVLLAAPQ